MLLQILTFFISIFVHAKSDSNPSCFVRIYSNQAEIIQPLTKLPLEFTTDDWNDIRSDSITLLGQNINITSQTIVEKEKSLNGAEIYVRSPMSVDKTMLIFTKGILIDETKNLVKIEDASIADQQPLFFTVSPDQIFYREQPSQSKFYVNFTYDTTDSKTDVSDLRSNLNWHTQYQLNLYNVDNTLIAMANIRNNGKSSISINQAELISGDFNLREGQSHDEANQILRSQRVEYTSDSILTSHVPWITKGNEVFGLYVFNINEPFVIDAKTNYLLPMFRPFVTVERYALISTHFSVALNNGKAQRFYRLISDRFLPRGNCIIRELERIVGETSLPDISANDKYEFSLGEEVDIVYTTNVSLISSTRFQEKIEIEHSLDKVSSTDVYLRTRSVYEINVQINNFKTRSITIEYEQKFYTYYRSIKLITSNNHQVTQHGASIKSNMTLKANDEQIFSYGIELVN